MNWIFLLALMDEEIRHTSWAEWRYHDNPDFERMLMMGNEI